MNATEAAPEDAGTTPEAPADVAPDVGPDGAPSPIPDAPPDDGRPTPEGRRVRPDVGGIGFEFGDGQTWVVSPCGLAKGMAEVRNNMFDDWVISCGTKMSDVYGAIFYGLAINYDLADAEIRELLLSVPPDDLVDLARLVAVPIQPRSKTFDAWARSALLSNGLKPSEVPAADLPHVLEQLVMTGRAVPVQDYTDSGVAAAKRAGLLELAARLKAESPGLLLDTETDPS